MSKYWSEERVANFGTNVEIGYYTVIGNQGFSIARHKDGTPYQVPHYGGVIIGDNVRIGSNCCIDRGTKPHTPTRIANNVMIDNLVHIGHNARIGDGTIIVAGAVIGGSSVIGKNCYIGENVSIKQHIKIGDQVIVGAGAVVLKDVPDRDIIGGCPSKSIKHKINLSDDDLFRMVGYRLSKS